MKVNEGIKEEGKIYICTQIYIYMYIVKVMGKKEKRERERERERINNMATWQRKQRRLADFSIPAVK